MLRSLTNCQCLTYRMKSMDASILSRTCALHEFRRSCLSIPWSTSVSVSRLSRGPGDLTPWKQIAKVCWRHIVNCPSCCVTHCRTRAQPRRWLVPGKQPEAKPVKVSGYNIYFSKGSPNTYQTTWPNPGHRETVVHQGAWSHRQWPTDN